MDSLSIWWVGNHVLPMKEIKLQKWVLLFDPHFMLFMIPLWTLCLIRGFFSNILHPRGGRSFVHATSCGHMVNNAATYIIYRSHTRKWRTNMYILPGYMVGLSTTSVKNCNPWPQWCTNLSWQFVFSNGWSRKNNCTASWLPYVIDWELLVSPC